MPDDWQRRWRGWLHRDGFAHPDSSAGGSGTGCSRSPTPIGHSWLSMPDPHSPAGRFLHWPTELWRLEQQARIEIARHVEDLEHALARRSDNFRASIPDSYLRTLYDRQVGRVKGAYSFTKSLASTGVDAAILLQKLTSPIGWSDPDLQNKLRQDYTLGLAIGSAFITWEFGTLSERKESLTRVASIAQTMYDQAKRNIEQQWSEAQRNGKQEELIEAWKTRLLLELGTFAFGAGELKGASSAVKAIEVADVLEDTRLTKSATQLTRRLVEGTELSPGSTEAVPRLLPTGGQIDFSTGQSFDKEPFTPQELLAQQRQAQMLKDNVGYNVSPRSWDKYPSIGRNGSYLTDKQAITDTLGKLSEGQNTMTISKAQARQLENNLGLEEGSLDGGFKIRKVEGIQQSGTRSPLEGNELFRGAGKHLPGGGPEMQVDSIPTTSSDSVSTTITVEVK